MMWLVTFAAVAEVTVKYLPPKPAVGCSNQCVGGYASTPVDIEGYKKFVTQFKDYKVQLEQMSQYHCTAPGLSQIVTTTECTAAAQVVGRSKTNAQPANNAFCISSSDGNSANDGKYSFNNLKEEPMDDDLSASASVLCHCRSCDEPSTSLQSPWWTVLWVGVGVCFAGSAVAAARSTA